MLILTVTDMVVYYGYDGDVRDFGDDKPAVRSTCEVIYVIVAWIVPMITQLSCLIFGWIRHRRGSN